MSKSTAPAEAERQRLGKGSTLATSAPQSSSVGLIIRQKEPTNLETPFDQVDSYLTPTELFYIRSHYPAPKLELASYQLRIDGAVRNPFSLGYKQLRDMPSETRVATLECAGNSRVFLIPQVAGAQWELGAVGNAEWTGVPLGALLERADLLTRVVPTAGDISVVEGRPESEERTRLSSFSLETRGPSHAPQSNRNVPVDRPRVSGGPRLPPDEAVLARPYCGSSDQDFFALKGSLDFADNCIYKSIRGKAGTRSWTTRRTQPSRPWPATALPCACDR
jgi:Oxidoreductase molybdopterin binding domain